jgi:hypothetical protein
MFQNNFTTTVNLGGGPPFGGNIIGLQQYVIQRRALLLATPEVAAVAPTITNLAHSSSAPGTNIYITADRDGPGGDGERDAVLPAVAELRRTSASHDGQRQRERRRGR